MNALRRNKRAHGFRFFATDALALAICGAAALVLRRLDNPLWWLLLIVAGHFFLFCNVFRVRRSFELGWAAALVVNVVLWASLGNLNWAGVLALQSPISLACIIGELRGNRYHGIFALRLNPRLADHLKGKIL